MKAQPISVCFRVCGGTDLCSILDCYVAARRFQLYRQGLGIDN